MAKKIIRDNARAFAIWRQIKAEDGVISVTAISQITNVPQSTVSEIIADRRWKLRKRESFRKMAHAVVPLEVLFSEAIDAFIARPEDGLGLMDVVMG